MHTYYYLARSVSGMDRHVSVEYYYYDSRLNGLIHDSTAYSLFLSALASYTKVAAEDVPRIIQD